MKSFMVLRGDSRFFVSVIIESFISTCEFRFFCYTFFDKLFVL